MIELQEEDVVDVVENKIITNNKDKAVDFTLMLVNENPTSDLLPEEITDKELTTKIEINAELYREFSILMDEKYENNAELKEKQVQSELETIFRIGLNEYKKNNTTTTTSLIYRGKPPRKDCLDNLGRIAFYLQIQHSFYPNFKPKQIDLFIVKGTGRYDKRTVASYRETIVASSIVNNQLGVYNVETFVSQIPKSVFEKVQKEIESKWK